MYYCKFYNYVFSICLTSLLVALGEKCSKLWGRFLVENGYSYRKLGRGDEK